MNLSFYLVPDKFAAHHLRQQLTQKSAILGTQVGTWPELLEIARTSYCLPLAADDWQDKLKSCISMVKNAFWHKSLTHDPDATTTIISQSLVDLLWAIGPNQKITTEIRKELSSRGSRHIKDLLALHKKMDGIVLEELSLIQALLATNKNQAIRTIEVHYVADISNLNIWQKALVDLLNQHVAKGTQVNTTSNKCHEHILWSPPVKGKSGLCHMQRNLFSKAQTKQKSQSGLQWLATRDYLQEVEIAAGMVQELIAEASLATNEIALLVPESQNYTRAMAKVFTDAGIPLSGLSYISNNRDLGRELLYHFLLCRKTASPAPMLQASLFSSPLLPWHEKSEEVSQQIMDGSWLSTIVEDLPEDQQRTAYFLSGKKIVKPDSLRKSLRGLMAVVNKGDGRTEFRQIALASISDVLSHLDEDDGKIHWNTLLKICTPKALSQKENTEINLQGVRVFHPGREPWKKVKHLLVLGFTEGNYPQTPGVFPVIPEEDRFTLMKQDITLPTRSAILKQRRDRFQRQLCSATQAITFFLPMMDSMGGRLKPTSSLGFMAQIFNGINSGEELIMNLEQLKARKQVNYLAIANEQTATPPRNMTCEDLELEENLLTKRKNSKGKTAPESPSGFATMMVSPLAWVFDRYNIDSHEWAAVKLDAMTIGSIAHEIFEQVFSRKQPLLQRGRIPAKIKTLFNQVIKKDYPFLERDEWQVECQQMIRQFTEAAISWLDFIKKNKLEILGEETNLQGKFNKHPIRGKADIICRCPDGKLLVIDYKTSKSTQRKECMEKGFDHQASLYALMLKSGEMPDKIPVKLKNHLEKSPEIGALYYTLRDQVVLGDSKAGSLADTQVVNNNIADNGLALIKERMKSLRHGTVPLNKNTDSDTFKDETGITPYAFDSSPLVSLFVTEEAE